MQRQAFDAKFKGAQTSINVDDEDQKLIDLRLDLEWQYSDSGSSSSPKNNHEEHEDKNGFEAIEPGINIVEDKILITNNRESIEYRDQQQNRRKLDDHDKDESRMFTFRSPELKPIKLFLPGTLQKKLPFLPAVLLVMISLVYCLHVFGAFGEKTLVREEMKLTLTTFKNLVWTLRVPVFTFFGFCYLKMYVDDIPSSFRLSSRNVKIVRVKVLAWCCIEVVFTAILPAIARLVQLYWLDRFTLANAIKNSAVLFLGRLPVLPVLFTFIAEFNLLYYEVKQYKEDIQKWKEGQCKARNYFIDILEKIKKAEKVFQPFLVVHLGIFILIFIPGVLSYIERFNAEGRVNKIFLEQPAEKMLNPVHLLHGPGSAMLMNNESDASQLTKKFAQPLALLVYLKQPQNNTMNKRQYNVQERRTEKVLDKKAQERIIMAALIFLGELLVLYLPLVFLGKINDTLVDITHTIRYGVKYDEQEESGFLIQNDKIVKEMLKTMKNVEGFQILGMRLTVIKTVLIAVLAPLLTLLIHIMIRDVDISP